MRWNHMQIEMMPEDAALRPVIGPGAQTREQAHGEIQRIIDGGAALDPGMEPVAQRWRAGAKDDTITYDHFIWAIYSYEGTDPWPAARAWIEDLARIMRGQGMPVDVRQPKDQ